MTFHALLLNMLLFFNVTGRFFSNNLNILPRYFNVIDVVIVFIIFIIFLISSSSSENESNYKNIFKLYVFFTVLLIIGIFLNYSYINKIPAVSQYIMYSESIILFYSIVNLPFSNIDISNYIKLLIILIVINLIIGFLQFIFLYSPGNSEAIIGTFSGNAEQYAGFIIIAIYYLIGKAKLDPSKNIQYALMIIIILALILMIDNKASWLGVTTSVFFILLILSESSFIDKAKYLLLFLLISILGLMIVLSTSASLGKFEGMRDAWESDNFMNLGKLKAYQDVLESYEIYPHTIVTGSGPATFYSRSSWQFYYIDDILFYNADKTYDKKGSYRTSNSMGGIISKLDIKPYYYKFFSRKKIYNIGSGQVDLPFSSYVALLGETGIVGTFLYLSIYIISFKKLIICLTKYNNDAEIYPFIVSTIGLFLYLCSVSIYNNWMETGRIATILWSMIAMVFVYDLNNKDNIITNECEA